MRKRVVMARTDADVVIIGSGAGGGTMASRLAELAEQGKRMLVLERGPRFEPRHFNGHELDMGELLYHEGGVSDAGVIAAALLHDTIEDTETHAREIAHEFGEEICAVVLEVSDDTRLDKVDRKRLQIERSAQASYSARLVKLADKICNLRDMLTNPPATWDLSRRREYFDWAKQVVDQVRATNPRLEAVFDRVYAQRP